jgi:Undecaprenyl-phosphate galactose phosphotransferase WbaP
MATDLLSLMLSGILGLTLRAIIGGGFETIEFYMRMVPLIIIFLGVYGWSGLYPSVGLSLVEELRRLTISSSIVFLLVTGFTFWVHSAEIFSRLVFAFTWIFALIMVPLLRIFARCLFVKRGLWGEPVFIVGDGSQAKEIANFLRLNLQFGLMPVALITDFNDLDISKRAIKPKSEDYFDINVARRNSLIVDTLVLVTSEIPNFFQDLIVGKINFGYKRLILIPNLHWVGSVGVIPYDLEGYLGLEVRQNLLSDWQQLVKRFLEICIVIFISPIVILFITLISITIRLDTKGKILYSQERIGKGGARFKMLKFRTMVPNSDEILEKFLDKDPEAKKEWEEAQKLRKDPRVTRIGSILRKSSLDELPQLWNVLIGEMSLVGPRPIVEKEINHYSQAFELYKQVFPGMTGLWQVSGRNDVGYEERIRFDEYYVRNWSIWLDLYIILRTIWTVIRGEGAY